MEVDVTKISCLPNVLEVFSHHSQNTEEELPYIRLAVKNKTSRADHQGNSGLNTSNGVPIFSLVLIRT